MRSLATLLAILFAPYRPPNQCGVRTALAYHAALAKHRQAVGKGQ